MFGAMKKACSMLDRGISSLTMTNCSGSGLPSRVTVDADGCPFGTFQKLRHLGGAQIIGGSVVDA